MFNPTEIDFRSLYVMYGIILGWLSGLLILALSDLYDLIHNKNKEKNKITRQ